MPLLITLFAPALAAAAPAFIHSLPPAAAGAAAGLVAFGTGIYHLFQNPPW